MYVASTPIVTVVKPGDTLSTIAAANYANDGGLSWQQIYQDNETVIGGNPNLILVGEKLTLGGNPPAQSTPTYSTQVSPANVPTSDGAPGSFQSCVIQRESGGNARAVNPSSGAGGLYQFLPSTWASLGYSGLPENAPVSEQTQAFNQLYAEDGTAPWAPSDHCS